MTMSLGERAKLYIAGFKGYGSGGFSAWGYPQQLLIVFFVERQIIVFQNIHSAIAMAMVRLGPN